MELPQINYDDFYKFIVSVGTVIASIGAVLTYQASSLFLGTTDLNFKLYLVFFLPGWLIFGLGFGMILWGGKKWYENQKLVDKLLAEKLRAALEK